jgi:hypothetical protein
MVAVSREDEAAGPDEPLDPLDDVAVISLRVA